MNDSTTKMTILELRRFAAPLRGAPRVVLVGLLLANLCLLAYFIALGYQGLFHSDAATKSLLAQEIYDTGKYLPRDWNYVNADLMLVFGHLFIIPLLPFFENGYSLHAVSGAISAGLILLGTWLVSGVLSPSPRTRLLCLVIVASGISGVTAENLFGQVSYGNVFYMACFTVFAAWRFVEADGRARWMAGGLAGCLLMLLFWSNPQRAIASYGLPLVVASLSYTAVALVRNGFRWNELAGRGAWLLALLVIASAIGIALHGWVTGGINNVPGAGAAQWLPFDGMAKNLVNTFHGLLAVLGGLPTASRGVATPAGLYEGVRFLAMLGILFLLPVALSRALKDRRDGVRFVAVFASVSLALFLFLHVTTTIPDMSDPVTTARYLVPPVLFSLLVLVAVVFDTKPPVVHRTTGAAAIAILAISAFSPSHPFALAITASPPDPRIQLVRLLESNGLKYGYGTYWNAGALTVLSGQRVKVRQIAVEQGMPQPMRHLSSNRWYRSDAWQGETFLLLRDAEAKSIRWDVVTAYAGKPTKTLRFDDFGIYVFPRNIAAVLPKWSDDLATPLSIVMSEDSFHQVGSLDRTSGRGALVSEAGQAGYLHFGPYLRLKQGTYRAVIDVETTAGASDKFGIVDVTSNGSATIHAVRTLDQLGHQKIVLEFTLDRVVTDLEVRVFSSGSGRMKLHGIELAPAN